LTALDSRESQLRRELQAAINSGEPERVAFCQRALAAEEQRIAVRLAPRIRFV